MRVHGKSKVGAEWSHDLVCYALDRFHRANLRTPTLLELKAGVADLPSYATIRRRYGSAGAMLRFHGYRARSPGGQSGRPCTLARDRRGRFLPKQAAAASRREAGGSA
jgi:hypothetical protein